MSLKQKDIRLSFVLATTLLLPFLLGIWSQQFPYWSYVSVPLHSLIESMGGISALIVATVIFKIYGKTVFYNAHHKVAFTLIPIGIFDLFHAMMTPGDLFVWLHTLSIFAGGLLVASLFTPKIPVSEKLYGVFPWIVLVVSLLLALISISNPSWVPAMIMPSEEFTYAAKWMNLTGGVMYLLAALFFTQRYLKTEKIADLWLAAWLYLFSCAGVLFFFSSLWDATWWFWHSLRWLGLVGLLGFAGFIVFSRLSKSEAYQMDSSIRISKLQKQNREYLEDYSQLEQNSLVMQLDGKGLIKTINTPWLTCLNQDADLLLSNPIWTHFKLQSDSLKIKQKLEEASDKRLPFNVLLESNEASEEHYFQAKFDPRLAKEGSVEQWLVTAVEVTNFVLGQKALKLSVYYDPLTSLPNRLRLNEDLQINAFAHLALINIDNFKSINDFYGIEFGDKVIFELSQRLKRTFATFDVDIYRHHGDEFALIMGYETSYEVFEKQLRFFSDDIENGHFRVQQVNLDLQISIGVVESSNSLVQADMALKECKQFNYQIVKYTPHLEMEQMFQKNIYWSQQIKQALQDDRIEIMLQPLMDNHLQRCTKYEALVRLIDEEGRVISPFEFLDVAKRTRLYHQITTRVVKKAFAALNRIQCPISVNLSVDDILNDETRDYLIHLLRESQNSSKLIIELVESDGIENFEPIKAFIDEVKSYGVRIAIDDFGTGYSNFEYLFKLNADIIKIDGSLIRNIHEDDNHYKVVETIVNFAHKANFKVVAEFVSNAQIQQKVLQLGVDLSQGYFISEPKFVDDFIEQCKKVNP